MTFNVGNDSPTLTGAKVTFTIDLEFPHNQKVQPNGEVVWAEDCILNGKAMCTHTHTNTHKNTNTVVKSCAHTLHNRHFNVSLATMAEMSFVHHFSPH